MARKDEQAFPVIFRPLYYRRSQTVASSSKTIQDWYTNRLREYLLEYYRASLAFDENEEEDPEEVCPRSTELSPKATRPDRAKLPTEVREAYEFYKKHVEDADLGSVRDYAVSAGGQK